MKGAIEVPLVKKLELKVPYDLDPETAGLVRNFAQAMAEKLYRAQMKYDYGTAWMETFWENECKQSLIDHLSKGDPRDVANYCAFMWHHGWKTSIKVSITP